MMLLMYTVRFTVEFRSSQTFLFCKYLLKNVLLCNRSMDRFEPSMLMIRVNIPLQILSMVESYKCTQFTTVTKQ